MTKNTNQNARAMFHLHSDIKKPEVLSDKVIFKNINVEMSFHGHSNINVFSYDLSKGFNKSIKAYKIVISFDKELITQINL